MFRKEFNCETGESRTINQVCYRDVDNKVHVLDEDAVQPECFVQITDEEAVALNAPAP